MPKAVSTLPSTPATVQPWAEGGHSTQDHLRLIAEITREFTASHDHKTIAQTSLERITKYMSAEAASLFLVGDTGDTLACSACYGPVDITGMTESPKTTVPTVVAVDTVADVATVNPAVVSSDVQEAEKAVVPSDAATK